jgi:hypothetical protein
MAQRVEVKLIDDLDPGPEAPPPEETDDATDD